MCGCMLFHSTIDHQSQQPVYQPPAKIDPTTGAGAHRCKSCGFTVDQGFTYCPGCGARQRATPCPACGQVVEPGQGTCEYCGYPLDRSRG